MRRRGGGGSIAANPVLIGAVTVLVVIVAVYLAYNANSGLPFVPTYDLKVEVPNAAGLVNGNEVRVGGTRVGTVSCIEPQTRPTGEVTAVLCLKLETVVNPLPVDTRVKIRPRSVLGLKYVQLTRGTSNEGLAANSTIPLKQALPKPVELDQFFNIFGTRTRRAIQSNLTSFGNGFSGRGADLNFTIRDLRPLLNDLEPVMRNLSSSKTDLRGFWDGLAQSAAAVAPVAEIQGQMYVNLDKTFSALADVAFPSIQDTISEGPPTLRAGIRDFPAITGLLNNSAALFHDFQPGFKAFAAASPDLAEAVTVGTPALQQSPAFNARLTTTFKAFEAFGTDPIVKLGVQDLSSTVSILNPLVAYVAPVTGRVQLHRPVLPQPLERAQRGRHERADAARRDRRRAGWPAGAQPAEHRQHAARAQQRGQPVLRAREWAGRSRVRRLELLAFQPDAVHRGPGPAGDVRSRQ